MLKHATPRSSPSLSISGSPPLHLNRLDSTSDSSVKSEDGSSSSGKKEEVVRKLDPRPFNERSVDCDGLVSREPLLKKGASVGGLNLGSFFGEKILSLGHLAGSGNGIGPVITQGKAIVRRGLSFNGKKDPDAASIRSVKSEGQNVIREEVKKLNLPTKANSEVALQTTTVANTLDLKSSSFVNNKSSSQINEPSKSCYVTNDPLLADAVKCSTLKSNQSLGSKKVFGPSKIDHPSLKSLLRLPGVYGHIPIPDGAPTGSPHILNPDSLSLNSADSFLSSNSGRTSSRSWSSNTSSNSNNTSDSCNSNASTSSSELTSTTLKVYAKCLRSDIEYKTVNIGSKVTCRQLINLLLSKARMRHRDSNLFYLTMEVTVRRWSGVPVRALLVLEESARPAQLALCRPSGDLRFVLQMRRGGVIKVHDTVLMPGSQYKSLLVSFRTTAEETVQLLLNCCGRRESKHYFALHEVCQSPQYKDRRLGLSEKPLEVKAEWPRDRKAEFVFVLRRNMSQALSLRKLSMLPFEVRIEKNTENDFTTFRGSTVLANSGTRATKSGENEGRSRARSMSPARASTNELDDALIDCTQTTPVMTFVKNQNKHNNYDSTSILSQNSQKFSDNHSQYNDSHNQTWAGTKNNESGCSGSAQNKFDITYPMSCSRRNIKEQTHKVQQKSVTFNLTNSVPTTRKFIEYTSNSLPKSQKVFHSTQNISNNHPTKPLSNTDKLLSDFEAQQEKFAKALAKLNPHKNDNEYFWPTRVTQNQSSYGLGLIPSLTRNKGQYHPETESINSSLTENKESVKQDHQSCNKKLDYSEDLNCAGNDTILSKKNSDLKDYKSKVLLSSAVQTELTCIPLKGIRNSKQKWNSVETLMDLQSPNCKYTKERSQKFDNEQQFPQTVNERIQKSESIIKEKLNTGHRPGVHCERNCKKCFYI